MGIVLNLEDRRRTAYREGGRALVGMLSSGADPVGTISIVPRGASLADEHEVKIRVALGGHCAEELAFDQPSTGHLSDDELRRIVEESHAAVLALLRVNRWRLDALASALLKYETLDEATAHAAAGLPAPGSAPGSFTATAFGAALPAA
jgi:cell division protease FtsH